MILVETHIAEISSKEKRLQEYGVGVFKRITTKSALKKAIKKEMVFVDGKVASTATFIKGGERIEYRYTADNKLDSRLKLNLNVIYEDEYLAIINKPAGILVSGNGFKTVANALSQNLKTSTIFDAVQPQPVHRLDYATTGCLLIGKTNTSIIALNKLFESKKIHKIYYAVTIGSMKPSGTIDIPIDDKSAISNYQVLETIASQRFKILNLVKLSPKTGRRHQLRKHLFAIGNPILGDSKYYLDDLLLKGKGLYLQAHSLEFIHPISEERMFVRTINQKRFIKLFPNYIKETIVL
jgi:23S rRNA pseudouridine1911/1915/1917 synthase